MPEHLNREQISRLLDQPPGEPGEIGHLAVCPECAHEYEQISRMRMALSALPDLEAPAGEWDAVHDRLGPGFSASPAWRPPWFRMTGWPMQAAAVLALFAAGLLAGRQIDSSAGDERLPAATAGAGSRMAIEPAEAYLRTVADLEKLRDGTADAAMPQAGPEAVAERITHLDAMIDASQEALREAPADPVLNNFLFQLVDERDGLAVQLDQTLRMTAAEY